MDLGLKDARVLVPAASQGLGAATARRFSLEGARVVISSRNPDKLENTAKAISKSSGIPVHGIAADVTDSGAVNQLVSAAVGQMGGLDVLITNAGGPPAGTFDRFDAATWEQAANLTLLSAVNLIMAALPHLRDSSRAAILAITSVTAKEPLNNLTLSNVLRPAVVGLTKTLSIELGGAGIRVNSILPGWTQTERVDELLSARASANNSNAADEAAFISQTVPLRRIGAPEEFANAAVFLCSPAAGYITGVALPVDGGAIHATL